MEFTYNGLVRYGFGFDNPNHAAALLSMLIPLLWGIRGSRKHPTWLRWTALTMELLLLAALLLTCSRSGILALLAAGLVYAVIACRYLDWRPAITDLRQAWRWLIPGMIIAALVIVLPAGRAGLTRLFAGAVAPDDSILNRFKVWHGALKLLTDNPGGVGTGNSGFIYTVTLHHGSSLTGYRTMVNSFLTLAVEQGLLVAWLVLTVVAIAVAAGIFSLRQSSNADSPNSWFTAGMLASLAAGMVTGWSSTCFDLSLLTPYRSNWTLNDLMQTLLLGLFLLLLAGLLVTGRRIASVGTKIKLLLLLGCVIGTGLFCGSGLLVGKVASPITVKTDRHGWLVVSTGDRRKGIVRFFPKSNNPAELTLVLPGLRAIFPDYAVAVPLAKTSMNCSAFSNRDLLMVSALPSDPTRQRLVIYQPEELPPEVVPTNVAMLILDRNDAKGVNRYWQTAVKHHVPVKLTSY